MFKKINKSKYLKKHFNKFIKTGIGTDELRDNPKDPYTWGTEMEKRIKKNLLIQKLENYTLKNCKKLN